MQMRIAPKLLSVGAAVAAPLFISSPTVQAHPTDTTAVVLKVLMATRSTFVTMFAGASGIRLLGIDTPETKKPGYTVGCWGPEATSLSTRQRA